MKKSLITVMIISLLSMQSYSASGSGKSVGTDQPVIQIAQEPAKQFLQVAFIKDIGEVELNQFMHNIGAINTTEQQNLVYAKEREIELNTLNSLKKLNPTDPKVKSYLDSVIYLRQLQQEIHLQDEILASEYEKNKQLSPTSTQILDDLDQEIRHKDIAVLEQEAALLQKYADATIGTSKEFFRTQGILMNDLIKIILFKQKLAYDLSIKTKAQFDKKAILGMLKINNNTTKLLKSIHPTDADVANYIEKTIESNRLQDQRLKKQYQVASKQDKNLLSSQSYIDLTNRVEQLANEMTHMRLALIKRLMN